MGAMSVPVEVGVPKNTDEALLQLTNKSGYTLVQENGQRRFGGPPPEWNGPPPAKGCEIFVGKIPRDCFEDELVPIFESIGPIYELRLMMDFSGTNRGFAFVMYCKVADAKEAIRKMDNYEIRKGRFLGVCKSIDNCRLFVGGIPHMKSREEVFDEMSKITEGVVNVILYSNVTDKSKSRGFAFVEYENHRSAAMARRKLIPGRIQLWSKNIAVDWAEPEPDIDEEIMSKVTILYARNLTQDITENNLKDEFSMNGKLQVEKVKKLKDYAFVHFKSRSDAEIAKSHFHGKILDGSEMEVTWAKPVDKNRNKSEIQRVPGSFVNAIGGPYGQLAGPYLYSNIPPNQVLDQSNPYASTLFTYPIAYPPAQNTGARNTFRGRGRGAAGLRGNNFGKNYRKATDMHLFDLQPGMELIPTNPYTLKPTKPPTQILMEFAQKNNWGEPVYQLHSAVNSDPNRDQIQLFLHKITFPNFPSQFTPTKLTNNVEESKQIAAEYVLIQMGISPETYDQVYYDPGAQLAVVPTVGIY